MIHLEQHRTLVLCTAYVHLAHSPCFFPPPVFASPSSFTGWLWNAAVVGMKLGLGVGVIFFRLVRFFQYCGDWSLYPPAFTLGLAILQHVQYAEHVPRLSQAWLKYTRRVERREQPPLRVSE